jgi:hypothetical protein
MNTLNNKFIIIRWKVFHLLLFLGIFSGGLLRAADVAPLSIDRDSLRSRRSMQQRKDSPLTRRRAGNDWEVAASTSPVERYHGCLYFKGERHFCRFGGLQAPLISLDGKKMVAYAVGGSIEPHYEKALFFFDARSGVRTKEVNFRPGNPLVAAASRAAKLFVVAYEESKELKIEAYDFDGNKLWQKSLAQASMPTMDSDSLAIAANGKSIFLAVVFARNPQTGKVLILDAGTGTSTEDIPIESPRVRTNETSNVMAIWNSRRYEIRRSSDRKLLASERCGSDSMRCHVKDLSPNGRYAVVVGSGKSTFLNRKEKSQVDLLDIEQRRILRDEVSEFGSVLDARVGDDGNVEVHGNEKQLNYSAPR